MYDNDPKTYPATPVVPTTPLVDPTTGPVTPVYPPSDSGYHSSPNPYPYLAGVLLLAIGLWGLFAYQNGRQGQIDTTERVTYVEQTLEPGPTFDTTNRVAEDRARDEIRRVREQERGSQELATRDAYDNEVASVDLTEPTYPRGDVVTLDESQSSTSGPVAVAVLDLDYSDLALNPLSDQELHTQVVALKTELDSLKIEAQQLGQLTGHSVLQARYDTLGDRLDSYTQPMVEPVRLEMTQQLTELQDELSAFRLELEGLEAGPK